LNAIIEIFIKYVLPGLLVAGLIGGLYLKIKHTGRDEERAVCVAEADSKAVAMQKEITALRNENELRKAEHEVRLVRIEDDKQEGIKHRDASVRDVRNTGLYVPKNRTGNDSGKVPTKGEGITVVAGRADRERLPRQVEEDLISLVEDAQTQGVIQLKECRAKLAEYVEIID